MSDAENEKKVHGMVAEFTSVDSLLAACRRIRDAGYTKTDAYTPFAVHGIDKALGIKPTALPWIALAGGLTGTTIALSMQIWMNGINYPYIISGKPFISLPAFMPVAFELTVLLASFGAFFGMWALNGLPKFSNPLFTNPRFDRVTDDTFFLYIDANDERYDEAGVRNLLADTGGDHISPVVDDDSSAQVPKFLITVIAAVIALSIIPALIVAKMRVTTSSSPRFHVFYDMDFSPAKDAQTTSTLFVDQRVMRADVPGTVARGEMGMDMNFLTGIDVEALSRLDAPRAERLVRAFFDPQDGDQDSETPAEEPKAEKKKPAKKQDNKKAESKKADEKPLKKEAADVMSADTKDDPKSDKQAADEKPADEKTADKKPADKKPADKKPAEMKPADKKPADKKPADKKPADKKPADKKPADKKPADKKPADKKPAEEKPAEMKAAVEEPAEPEMTEPAADAAAESVEDTTPWLTKNPMPVTEELLRQGQTQFKIYCSVCHGLNGSGNGLVNRRARKIMATSWIPPSSLHQASLYQDKYPDGKLFSTITNGIRKMPGYGSQIKSADRWALVAYVRALQASQNASIDLVPEDLRKTIEAEKKLVDEILRSQAEAERKKEEERAAKAGV